MTTITTIDRPMTTTYHDFLASQPEARKAFGAMLLNWRKRNGWTQYTLCSWATSVGMPELAVSYGNLSVIEQGKAGELRQKAFFQLGELNRRTAKQDWGHPGDPDLLQRLKTGQPIGDASVPVWGALQFWGCYVGLRRVPQRLTITPAPRLSTKQAAAMCSRWRRIVRERIAADGLDPDRELRALHVRGGSDLFRMLTGFGDYTPTQLAELWIEGDRYQPDVWIEGWANA
jgi:hypothetical protein